MSKKPITDVRKAMTYVEARIAFDDKNQSCYTFDICYEGNIQMDCIRREDLVLLRDCINAALEYTEEKGGDK